VFHVSREIRRALPERAEGENLKKLHEVGRVQGGSVGKIGKEESNCAGASRHEDEQRAALSNAKVSCACEHPRAYTRVRI